MEAVLALIAAAAQLVPEVTAALPTVEALIKNETVSAAQMVTLWTAVQAIEAQAAAAAAKVIADGQPAPDAGT